MLLKVINEFTKWGVRFRPLILASFSFKGFFKLKKKFRIMFSWHIIVMGHEKHVWSCQRASSIFGGGWHHQANWFYLRIWQVLWYAMDVQSSTINIFQDLKRPPMNDHHEFRCAIKVIYVICDVCKQQ
jgi:hypothetical protein